MLEMSSAAPKVTKRIKIWLDADLIDWFKPVLSIVEGAKQKGVRGYQTAINAALRGVVEGERRKAG